MDETNTATSSSAAAVADGASAAAHTKTVGTAPIKSASHVKLLIKSSNQQYEDHVIESDMLWTVKRLKSHLSVVYPSKPPSSDQKLIYSGQLLNDNLLLKDVIRSYKDVYTHNHIIHLVYTPKNLPPPPSATKTKTSSSSMSSSSSTTGAGDANMATGDGLRHRHTVGNNNATQQSPNIQQQMFQQHMNPFYMAQQMMTAGAGGMPCPQNLASSFAGHYNMQAMVTQQAAMYNWMQQVYSQYMEQCLRLSNTVNGITTDASAAVPMAAPFAMYPPNFQQMLQQQFPSTVMNPMVVQEATAPIDPNGAAAEQSPDERQDPLQQQQPAQAQVAAPRFPNLPQDEHDNRDWLDNFFSITRLALFLTVLYFNSSPLRCLVVLIIAGGIYLYHIGVLRLRNERNNNNLNRNNNAAQNAAVDQIRQGVDQQQNVVVPPAAAVAAAAAAAVEENNAAENAVNNNENNTPAAPVANEVSDQATTDTAENANNESVMSTIRTFVPSSDQKLIYSGQLLNDNLLLKDVIRSYKDVYTHNHIIHLVYTPKNLPPPPSATKTKTSSSSMSSSSSTTGAGDANMATGDGLRHRHTVGNNNATQQSPNIQQQMFQQHMNPFYMAQQMMTAGAGGMPCPQNLASSFAGHYNMQAMVTQQAAMYNWMQQVYSQYMEQCLRLSNTVNGITTDASAAVPMAAPFAMYPPNFQQMLQQQFPSTVMNPMVVQEATAPIDPNGAAAEQSPDERQDPLQQQQPAQAQVAAPRFPNLPQDEHDNRDWLDNFFSITRLALFLTVLYFNSSPLRCLVVLIIAGGIYLYHIGVLRLRNERNNNNLNRNNNAAQNAAVDQIRQGVDQQQNVVVPPAAAVAAAAAAAVEENNAAENAVNNNENNTPAAPVANEVSDQATTDTAENANNESVMSTIRTFVVTFFTSLLPETPAL